MHACRMELKVHYLLLLCSLESRPAYSNSCVSHTEVFHMHSLCIYSEWTVNENCVVDFSMSPFPMYGGAEGCIF